ncbi:FAD:protein FMN transferase [Paenibacillus sp. P46E]|uniref:FAD:protein FMN transferase n=1 Tax=Paenibacillus sp. P46E TaxID=1349436 RepID=UPI00093990D8|nr:FAD:protein FMN transferase [Paenibacillus sp. P46E]OKP98872.1 thiamine biosynthesis protein ApbE [Paenibacillus sp. P46E]
MKRTKLFMDTTVEIQVITGRAQDIAAAAALDRAFEAFRKVEQACSRFSPDSELMQATRQIQTPVPVSPFLFEPLKFALEVAEWTDGLFDPTVGQVLEDLGFNEHYLTQQAIHNFTSASASYRDIVLDEEKHTLYLQKPLVIDLGAVAKGFAIDLAAHELQAFDGFVVNAGGDLYAGGLTETGSKWKIGIQHPVHQEQIIHTVELSNEAICTSGSYERRSSIHPETHHIIDPGSKQSPHEMISCSVIAPYAMMADAFSTASFLSGVKHGTAFIEQVNLKALFITSDLTTVTLGGIHIES